jgi:PiT family inorganic phosphate transporter
VEVLVVVVVVTALVFDSTNGFHDTANAMATSIATISSGLVNEARIGPAVVFGGLVAYGIYLVAVH